MANIADGIYAIFCREVAKQPWIRDPILRLLSQIDRDCVIPRWKTGTQNQINTQRRVDLKSRITILHI